MNNELSNQEFNKYQLITRKEAAQILGTTSGTLANWAHREKMGLPYIKIGASVRYKLKDVLAFIEQQTLVIKQEDDK
jgi:excisionase family DNA binding protein